MKKNTLILFLTVLSLPLLSQNPEYYTNSRGDQHLIGEFELDVLRTDTLYAQWFNKGYDLFELRESKPQWTRSLKDFEVTIYLGTWCGDSKYWVPRFIKLWEEAGLSTDQLRFIGLYGRHNNKYKQGPNGEEKGLGVHRVPTFIFKKEGKETARIVESPVSDLITDVAQIAVGYPSKPNYKGASFMLELLATKTKEEIDASFYEYVNRAYRLVKKPSELNTLGYVLLDAGRIDDALIVFQYNSRIYPYNPNMYDSYAEALAKAGRVEESISNYEKVLLLDRSNENAIKQRRELLMSGFAN